MKAVVFKEKGKVVLEERPMPEIRDGKEALIRVTKTTICSSDIHIKHGAVPRAVPGIILGHEFTGEVAAVGKDVKKFHKGDRVAVNVETFCGKCFYCRQGYVNNCEDEHGGWALGCRIDGGQAEYCVVPYADNGLTRIPDHVSYEDALFTGDILSTGYWSAKIAELKPSQTVTVIGAGPTGLCTMMCAKLYSPAKIIAVDTDRSRLELARKQGLADVILCPDEMTGDSFPAYVENKVKEESHGRGADVVFEAAGGKDTFEMAWRAARPNANVILVAMYEQDQILPLPEMYGKNLTFKTGGVDGSYCEEIMELIACGKLDTGCLITHRTALDHAMEAYDLFEKKRDGVIKYVLDV